MARRQHRHEDEYEDGEYEDDEYEDDEYEDDEYEDDEYEDESVRPRGRATLGDPMAAGGNFVRKQRRPPPRPAQPLAPAQPASGPGGVGALRRIREEREQEEFRRGFLYGAGVVAAVVGLAFAVIALTDGGEGRRAEAAQIELERVRELAEDGDAEPSEVRVAEIMALIAGPADPDAQVELAHVLAAQSQLSRGDVEWIERAADLSGEGPVNPKILAATRTAADYASDEPGPDIFTTDKKTSISKRDVKEMDREDMDGRDLGLGKLARTQRQNRKTMGKAHKVGKAMLKAGGNDPDDVDVEKSVEHLQ